MKYAKTLGLALAALFACSPIWGAATSRLINISQRASVDATHNLIAGFVFHGGDRTLLIRAAGPALSLAPFNLSGTLDDPKLTLYQGQTVIATNDNWGTQSGPLVGTSADVQTASQKTGAFWPWQPQSKDAAMVVTLHSGVSYTAVVESASGKSGIALVEVYDASGDGGLVAGHLVNASIRAWGGNGLNSSIIGAVVNGTGSHQFLIRASGKSIAKFGVTDPMSDPSFEVHALNSKGQDSIIASNDDATIMATDTSAYPPTVIATAAAVGAFPQDATEDSATIITVSPGSLTAVVRDQDPNQPNGGTVLTEIYDPVP